MNNQHTFKHTHADHDAAPPLADEPAESAEPEPPSPNRATEASDHPLRLEIEDVARTLRADTLSALIPLAEQAALQAGVTGGELRVHLINDNEMSDAHLAHCGIAGTTDVITFNLHSEPGTSLDADLLVCIDEAQRQANDRGHTLERELLLYILHGILHCLGYDDTDDESFEAIHAREDEILRAIGVGETFNRGTNDGGAS